MRPTIAFKNVARAAAVAATLLTAACGSDKSTGPNLPSADPNIQVAAGGTFNWALKADGTVWSWGNNAFSQLGRGDNNELVPGKISYISNVVKIAAGHYHAMALLANGTVWLAGNNTTGAIGVGTLDDRNFGSPAGLTNVVQIAAGDRTSLALKSDGTVWEWGAVGVSGNVTTPTQVVGLSNVTKIAAGGGLRMARTADGKVWAWGSNYGGGVGVPSGPGSANFYFPTPVQVAGHSNVFALAPGNDNSATHALILFGTSLTDTTSGTLTGWGEAGCGTTTITGVPALSFIDGGADFGVGIRASDGALLAFGCNYTGQLGTGDTTATSTFVAVPGMTNVASVSTGFWHTLVAKKDGTVWAWGHNFTGKFLPDTNVYIHATPQQIPGFNLKQ